MMRLLGFFFGMLFSALACADPTSPFPPAHPAIPVSTVIPLNQALTAVDYSRENRQTGCGLRITGDTANNLWLNVLVTVFIKESGASFGILKVVAKKIIMQDGAPQLQDGRIVYSSIGEIHKAWIKTDSGVQPRIFSNGESPHKDGYLATMEFSSAINLLVAVTQESFLVGLKKNPDEPDEIFKFNKRIGPEEAGKLTACMKNLRDGGKGNSNEKTS
jgi:hypothetical protein